MRFITSGKVKDVYDAGGGRLLFRFSDRVSAYDVKFREAIPEKGRVLCGFAEYWFGRIRDLVPNHFVERVSDTEIIVERMRMIPMECVVRGYLYGSLAKRRDAGDIQIPGCTDTRLAAKLPSPLFDPTTKSEHDVPVDEKTAVRTGLVTGEQFGWLSSKSVEIYQRMASVADGAGFILADLKLEFGIHDGRIVLGDSVGPDECRLWPKESYSAGKTQEAYDKQILRDWLSEHGHAERFDEERNAGREPVPPPIPPEIITKMTRRYVAAYQRIAGRPSRL